MLKYLRGVGRDASVELSFWPFLGSSPACYLVTRVPKIYCLELVFDIDMLMLTRFCGAIVVFQRGAWFGFWGLLGSGTWLWWGLGLDIRNWVRC